MLRRAVAGWSVVSYVLRAATLCAVWKAAGSHRVSVVVPGKSGKSSAISMVLKCISGAYKGQEFALELKSVRGHGCYR